MAATASPYGLRPVNMQGGQPMSHGLRLYKIASAYATSIFYGDVVRIGTNGFLEKMADATNPSILPVGVFLGVEYEDDAMGLLHRQMWTASTATKANKPIWGYVCDDPDALFEIQADGPITQAMLGANADLIQTAGSTFTGNSAVALDSTTPAATATMPMRIVDFVNRPGSSVGDAFTDVVVRFNLHIHRSTTGVA